MPQPLIIFGASSFASMMSYVMAHDSDYEVAAFAVDSMYLQANLHDGKPVVAFEEVEAQFPPDSYAMLVPLGGHGDRNDLRASRYLAAKRKGYRFATYVSSRAIVWPDLRIGENSMIFEAAVVQPHASIGNNCMLRSQVCVSHHARIGDHCFLAAGAVVGGNADVGARCFLGLNSTVRDGVTVPPACLIGAGAVVVSDLPAAGTYTGIPARIQTPGYAD
jgi:sugar O-acyltransferase (sialic acid O-acetyltransferase NeuD family)